jgi:hypothetical protein
MGRFPDVALSIVSFIVLFTNDSTLFHIKKRKEHLMKLKDETAFYLLCLLDILGYLFTIANQTLN